MNIRKTTPEDLAAVMDMYSLARKFMSEHGNGNQWINGYPSAELISHEIACGHSYVCEKEEGELVGTFCYIEGEDPTYRQIYEGAWLNDAPYAVVHRMASSGKQKGVADECLKWCFARCRNIRIDTHRDNTVMQNILKKHGFIPCGIIFVSNGTERLAFHRVGEAPAAENYSTPISSTKR